MVLNPQVLAGAPVDASPHRAMVAIWHFFCECIMLDAEMELASGIHLEESVKDLEL